MPDRSLEARLDAFFADSPPLPDAPVFAARVGERLDRNWTFRRFVIGGLGLLGGLIGGAQVLSGGVLGRLDDAAHPAAVGHVVADRLRETPAGAAIAGQLTTLFSNVGQTEGEALLMSVALALFAAGLLITRAIRDI